MAYAALANGGRLYVPQVVRRVQRPGAEVVAERPPVLRRHIAASPTTLDILRRGMTRAVNARGGTAFTARRGAVKMVGKTGTFEPPDRDEADALFAGWAPSEHPEIAVVVLIERGGVGGAVAAPVARDIIDGYFTRVHPPPHKARAHRDKKKSEKTAQKTATKKTEKKKKDAHRKARAHQDRKRPRR
jgi:penicillin-binding protein 2